MSLSKIQWTDRTWNPVRGCSRISPGCVNCYAEKIAARFSDPGQPFHLFADRSKPGSKWTGRVELAEDKLTEPLRWRKPQRVFVNSMSDLFHEALSDEDIDRVFAVMALCPQHTFQILTKRADRMREWASASLGAGHRGDKINSLMANGTFFRYFPVGRTFPQYRRWPLSNVWLGVSVEDEPRAERIKNLLATPAAVRFVSYEPALEAVNFRPYLAWESRERSINWLIVGGESGPGARPFNLEWARDAVKACYENNVPVFVKQLGSKPISHSCRNEACTHPDCGPIAIKLRDPKGGDPTEWPIELRVREFPGVRHE